MQPVEIYEDTNRHNLQKCYLGISWFSGCDQGSPTKTMCGPRGEFQNRTSFFASWTFLSAS